MSYYIILHCLTLHNINGWAGLAWPGLAWPGLAWPGLAWAGLGWAGLGWAGLEPDAPPSGYDSHTPVELLAARSEPAAHPPANPEPQTLNSAELALVVTPHAPPFARGAAVGGSRTPSPAPPCSPPPEALQPCSLARRHTLGNLIRMPMRNLADPRLDAEALGSQRFERLFAVSHEREELQELPVLNMCAARAAPPLEMPARLRVQCDRKPGLGMWV